MMEKLLTKLLEKAEKLLSLFGRLLILMQEQRSALKARELNRIEDLTADLTGKLNQLRLEQNEIKNLSDQYKSMMGYPAKVSLATFLAGSSNEEEQHLSDLLKELISLGEQIKIENYGNLLRSKNSIEVMGQIISCFCPQNQVKYENDGTVKLNSMTINALNKTI